MRLLVLKLLRSQCLVGMVVTVVGLHSQFNSQEILHILRKTKTKNVDQNKICLLSSKIYYCIKKFRTLLLNLLIKSWRFLKLDPASFKLKIGKWFQLKINKFSNFSQISNFIINFRANTYITVSNFSSDPDNICCHS